MLEIVFSNFINYIGFIIIILSVGLSISFPVFLIYKVFEEKRLAEQAKIDYLNKIQRLFQGDGSSFINN